MLRKNYSGTIIGMLLSYFFRRSFTANLKLFLVIISNVFFIAGCKKEDTPAIDTPPTYTDFNKLGYGYDVTREFMNVTSTRAEVIDMKKLYDLSSNRIIIDNLEDETSENFAGENWQAYSKSVSAKVDIDLLKFFGSVFKNSFSYFDSTSVRSNDIVASYHNYVRKKQLKINAPLDKLKASLSSAFIEDAKTQTPKYLVDNYGTCVLKNIILGGKLEVVYRAQTTSTDRKSSATAGLSSSIKELFGIAINGGINGSSSNTNSDQHLYYHTIGGNSSYGLIDQIALADTVQTRLQIKQWHNSITLENAQLIDIGGTDGMILLSDLIDDPQKSAQVAAYIKEYLIANQIVLGDPPNQIYVYYDGNNNKHAYSLGNVPSIKGNFINAGPAFKGYSQNANNGSIPIYEQYNANKNVWIYSQSSTAIPGFTANGVAFYAFATQVAGTIPIYEFYFERVHHQVMSYDYYYKTDQVIPDQDTHFTQIAFYAYP